MQEHVPVSRLPNSNTPVNLHRPRSENLLRTMYARDNGCGLAAPQCGVNLRVRAPVGLGAGTATLPAHVYIHNIYIYICGL